MKKFLLGAMTLSLATTGMATDFSNMRSVPEGLSSSYFEIAPVSNTFTVNQAPAKSENEDMWIDFTVGGEPEDALRFNGVAVGTTVYEAIQFTKENADLYAGNKITKINVASGYNSMYQTNRIRKVTVFIADSKDKIFTAPIYKQDCQFTTAPFNWNSFELDEPFEIKAGQELYIGAFFPISNGNDYYVVVDMDGSVSSDLSLAGYVSGGTINWIPLDGFGNLCVGATISGDNLPKDAVIPTLLQTPSSVAPGSPFEAYLTVKGAAATVVNNVEVEYTIGNAETQTINVDLGNGIGFNQTANITLSNLVSEEAGMIDMTAKVTKVNGVENGGSDVVATTSFACFDPKDGLPRVHVVEEFTGTWCGWCPRGLVMMEYVKDTYPDQFARIGIHYNDVMAENSCVAVAQELGVPGFPYMVIDRTYGDDPGVLSLINEVAKDNSLAIFGISSLGGTVENGNLTIDANVKFVFDANNANDRYRLAYYITEDNVGPYPQTNYYAGGGNGACGGWEKLGATVPTVFEDVARRYIGGMTGFANSIPANIVGGEEYSHSTTVSLSNVKNNDFYLTALIIDNTTGEIANAKQVRLNKLTTGVADVAEETVVAKAYYDLSGRVVENPSNGVYIERTTYSDGSVKAAKVVIK